MTALGICLLHGKVCVARAVGRTTETQDMVEDLMSVDRMIRLERLSLDDIASRLAQNGRCRSFWRSVDSLTSQGTPFREAIRKAELPDIKIMILEPFVLRGRSTDDTPEQPDRFEKFKTGVSEMAKAARRVAEKNGLVFVELQDKFDKACELAEPSYWLADGVHPTAMGHELIKREWLKAFAVFGE